MDLWSPSFLSNLGLVGLHPDLHGFNKWVIDAFSALTEFLQKMIQGRKDPRHQAWANWIRDDIDSDPFNWFRLYVVLLALYPVCMPAHGSVILVHTALL